MRFCLTKLLTGTYHGAVRCVAGAGHTRPWEGLAEPQTRGCLDQTQEEGIAKATVAAVLGMTAGSRRITRQLSVEDGGGG